MAKKTTTENGASTTTDDGKKPEKAKKDPKSVSYSVSFPIEIGAEIERLRLTVAPGFELGVSQVMTAAVKLLIEKHPKAGA